MPLTWPQDYSIKHPASAAPSAPANAKTQIIYFSSGRSLYNVRPCIVIDHTFIYYIIGVDSFLDNLVILNKSKQRVQNKQLQNRLSSSSVVLMEVCS